MKNRIFMWFASAFVLVVMMSFGCGGGGGDDYTGPTSTVIISGSSTAQGVAISADGTVLFDADGISEGSGGEDGVESIFDAIKPECKFDLAGEALANGTSEDGLVEVRLSTDDPCVSENKCITCTVSGYAQNCTISCEGTIPSNAVVGADSVKIMIDFRHEFFTDMPEATNGVLGFLGEVSNWAEFVPANVQYDYTYCDADEDYMDATTPALFLGDDADSWHSVTGFEDADQTPISTFGGHDNLQNCKVSQSIVAEMPLDGAQTPGGEVDITGGSITVTGVMCDDMGTCTILLPYIE